MEYNAFAITFNSLHLPRKPEDRIVWNEISSEGIMLVESMYNFLHDEMNSTSNPVYRAKRLQGSLFVFCIPEGLAMLKCEPDAEKRDAPLNGFLLRKDESLRTAWKLVRWQTLFLCAGGWQDVGKVSYSPDFINKRAAAMQFDKEYQEKLIKMGFDMMAAPAPFNFAMTNYTLKMLPLKFSGNHYVTFSDKQWEVSGNDIIIDEQDLSSYNIALKKKYWWINKCRMYKTSRKQLMETLLEEQELIMPECKLKEIKTSLKSELFAFQSDDIWCIRIHYSGMTYTEPINPPTNTHMLKGSIMFEELEMILIRVAKHAEKYFTDLMKLKEDEARRQKQERDLHISKGGDDAHAHKKDDVKSERKFWGKWQKKKGD